MLPPPTPRGPSPPQIKVGVLIRWCSDRRALATMGNGLLIRPAQIKTGEWSSFLLPLPLLSSPFPTSLFGPFPSYCSFFLSLCPSIYLSISLFLLSSLLEPPFLFISSSLLQVCMLHLLQCSTTPNFCLAFFPHPSVVFLAHIIFIIK